MSIKKLLLVASMLLAFGSVSSWAATEEESTDSAECVTQAEVDAMSDEAKANLEVPVCEEEAAEDAKSD